MDATTPRYLELRRWLRRQVEQGTFQPGAPIPSLNELAAEHGVNRLTVLKAVEPLVGEGILKPVVGRGFFVVGEAVARELETLDGFTRTMTERNAQPSVKVLTKALRPAGPKHAATFGLAEDDDLVLIKRLCLAGGEPFSLEEILFPATLLPDPGALDLKVFSLYELFSFYGVTLSQAWQTVELTRLDQKDARTLGVTADTAVLLFECTSRDADDRVVEFTRTYTRSDRANFVIHFRR
ncbi:GntR family transcriptional regulator [Actinotalea subterranea]|uniref:GntR family transcriptional regulator n=1 Tax=Actinotalea subterranea TaxID=2607497 RepID=UPI0011EE683E|nr:GntR family transcriptional regulator [Actinotalea subterranea]